MAPLVNQLRNERNVRLAVCVTAQHRQMLDQVLEIFEIKPDYDLDVMKSRQDLTDLTTAILSRLTLVFDEFCPELVLVHGDTTTTMAGSIAAFYRKIPIGHVEAGLRTTSIDSPWPEEGNRRITGILATHHFAPTKNAVTNLVKEGHDSKRVYLTGNTVIDALYFIADKIKSNTNLREGLDRKFSSLINGRKLILVTGHRRENFGAGIENICEALLTISKTYKECQIVYPAHLNPNVSETILKKLGSHDNILVTPPQDYVSFVYLLQKAFIVLTDSGGIQEEAPALGKPVLVMRNDTERPEAIEAGTAILVGTNATEIVSHVGRLLNDTELYRQMSNAINPYGDGHASERIVATLRAII